MKILIALFLIAHGLVHGGLAAAPDPDDPGSNPGAFFTSPDRSWLLSKLGFNPSWVKWLGIGLVAAATLGFVLAGMGVFGIPGLAEVWRTIAVISAGLSLILLILFWHPWLILGVLIDLGIIISLLWMNWPSAEQIGS
jgi:fatty acid desaturase